MNDPSSTPLSPDDSSTEPGHHSYDWQAVDPSTAVVEAVAAATNRDPLEMSPLFEQVDPEALDSFVEDAENGQVNFSYAGEDVTVWSDGTVAVAPDDRNRASSD